MLGFQFRESIGKGIRQHRDEGVQERLFDIQKGIIIPHCPAQNAANHVPCTRATGQLPIGNGEGNGADVVGNDPHCDVRLGVALIAKGVFFTRYFFDVLNKRRKYIGIVSRFFALHDHTEALEAHPGIHVLLGQHFQGLVGFAVELDEYVVPDFHHS